VIWGAVQSRALSGFDFLLSIVQMPGWHSQWPTLAIGTAATPALLAAQIPGHGDPVLGENSLMAYKGRTAMIR